MPKFFVSKSQINGDAAQITGEDIRHISNVLRLAKGDSVVICSNGYDYAGVIDNITNLSVSVKLLGGEKCLAEPDVNIVLYQGIPKQGKMEQIIQKCTELGVLKIVPVVTKRCVAQPKDKMTRWQRVAKEAAKQSGRGIMPQIGGCISFAEAVGQMSRVDTALMFYEAERSLGLKDVLDKKRISEIAIMIGPEGGFEPSEVQHAKQANILSVSLGRRILRTETAAAAVIPIIMYTQGQM